MLPAEAQHRRVHGAPTWILKCPIRCIRLYDGADMTKWPTNYSACELCNLCDWYELRVLCEWPYSTSGVWIFAFSRFPFGKFNKTCHQERTRGRRTYLVATLVNEFSATFEVMLYSSWALIMVADIGRWFPNSFDPRCKPSLVRQIKNYGATCAG